MKIEIEVTSTGQARLLKTMAQKLRQRASAKPRKWGNMSAARIHKLLLGEVQELREAKPKDVWEEAADVANFAAMYADVKTPQTKPAADAAQREE